MFASCTGQENELRFTDWHCDVRKDDWFDEKMPLLTNTEIEKCVRYTLNGSVRPFHDIEDSRTSVEKAMIDHLGLTAPYLVRNRRKAIQESELMEENDFGTEDWEELLRFFDNKQKGKYEEYCGMFTQIISREYLS